MVRNTDNTVLLVVRKMYIIHVHIMYNPHKYLFALKKIPAKSWDQKVTITYNFSLPKLLFC